MAAINIKTLSNSVPIKSFTHKLEPLWASDTGRNSNSGKFTGTLIGYFSQIVIEFGSCTDTQMQTIKTDFEKSTFQLTYPSSDGTTKTEYFYCDAVTAQKNNWNGRYKPFSLTFTGVSKYK